MFHGSAPGVELTVTADGDLADLHFATAGYRNRHTDDLGNAIVAAYREAREAAIRAAYEELP